MANARKRIKSPETIAAKAVNEAVYSSYMVLKDITSHIKDCPFIGWTINQCLQLAVRDITGALAGFPKPHNANVAKEVNTAIKEAVEALQIIEESADFFDTDYDGGINKSNKFLKARAAMIAVGMEQSALKSAKAVDRAAILLGMPETSVVSWELGPNSSTH